MIKKNRKIRKVCLVCSKEFFVVLSRKNKAKYCSRKCFGETKKGRNLEDLRHKKNCSCCVCRAKRKEPSNHKEGCKCFICSREKQVGEKHPSWVKRIAVKCRECKKSNDSNSI